MTETFYYETGPVRVLFGSGTLSQLAAEADRLELQRILILSTAAQATQAQEVAALLSGRAAGTFARATMHTPTQITYEALAVARELQVDGLVAIGGGSAIGLGKAITLRIDIPHIAVPTTYAGSEMTPLLGETEAGVKKTVSNPRVRPKVAIYDVDLTRSLPPSMSAASGMNAIAHAVEALYAKNSNPIISLLAEEGVRALFESLPSICASPQTREARHTALYGAWLCGTCLGAVEMSLHHKICHALGGAFDLAHAETHAIVLPYVLAFNAQAVPSAMAQLSKAMSTSDPVAALENLKKVCGLPRSLKEIGMPSDGVDFITDLIMQKTFWNPRPLERSALGLLISSAYAGRELVQDAN